MRGCGLSRGEPRLHGYRLRDSQRPAGSACAVGLVRVRDGQVVHKSGGLVRPPEGRGEFADFKTSVHGITAEMVASAPAWPKVAAWIVQYAGPDILICHNAGFHIGVLRHACSADKIPWPQADFLCTMVLARRVFQLPSYRLPFVAAECGVELAATRCSSTHAARPWSRSPWPASTGPPPPANSRTPPASAPGTWSPAATSPLPDAT
jgi:hypothetical protein